MKQTTSEDRESVQQKEWRNNPTGNLHDSLRNGQGGIPTGLSTKWLGTLLLIIMIVSVVLWMLFK